LDGSLKLSEGRLVATAKSAMFDELPQSFDQVQTGRIDKAFRIGVAMRKALSIYLFLPHFLGHFTPILPSSRLFSNEPTKSQKSTAGTGRIGHGGATHQTAYLCSKLNCASLPRPQGRAGPLNLGDIDLEQVCKLAGWGLTQNDIASFVGWSQSLISLGF